MENLSGGDCCDCDCDCCCDGGKTKSTPNLGFRLRLEFDKRQDSRQSPAMYNQTQQRGRSKSADSREENIKCKRCVSNNKEPISNPAAHQGTIWLGGFWLSWVTTIQLLSNITNIESKKGYFMDIVKLQSKSKIQTRS